MHIVHVSPWRLPVEGYGGSQRVLTWLVRAQQERGDRITVFAPPGTPLLGARVFPVSARPNSVAFWRTIVNQLPADTNVIHCQQFPVMELPRPWVVTVHGNSPGELTPHPRKIFVSRSHAQRAGSAHYVYNGIDPEEFLFRERKDDYVLFLAKASRKSKGVDTALQLARELGFELVVAGGTRWDLRKTGGWWNSWRARVHFLGEVDGRRKTELLAGARALLSPIRWEEPFGLAVVEALVSGTPVITAPRGAMPEIITPKVGALCSSLAEYRYALRHLGDFSSAACRQRVLEAFTHRHMAEGYATYYQQAFETWPVDLPTHAPALPPPIRSVEHISHAHVAQ